MVKKSLTIIDLRSKRGYNLIVQEKILQHIPNELNSCKNIEELLCLKRMSI